MRAGAVGFILMLLTSLGGLNCTSSNRLVHLDFTVIDAKYSSLLDRLILVSDDPPMLHVLDPRTGQDSTVALPVTPTCVGLTADGTLAGVGHAGALTTVDLASSSILATYPLPTNVVGVVFTGRVAHAVPDESSPVLESINLATGQVVQQSGHFFLDSIATAHPDGLRIYSMRPGVSIDKVDRYELQSGTLVETTSSIPGYPDAPLPGCDAAGVWLSEDGRRAISGCGNVYRTSPLVWFDLSLDGQLAGVTSLVAADQSLEIGRTLVLAEDSPGAGALEARLYEDSALGFEGSMPLPWPGRFVFFDGPGKRFFVVMDAPDGHSSVMAWGYDPALFQGGDTLVEPPAQAFPILSTEVADAEYSQALDRIVTVSSDPPALHVLDPETLGELSVTLPAEPTSVSIAPDGLSAAVGHTGLPGSGRVSLVDLVRGQLVATWPLTTQVRDVVLDGALHAYTTSVGTTSEDSSVPFAIDLTTGKQSFTTGNYDVDGNTRLKRHPTQPAVYLADQGEGPTGLVRNDISTGVLRYSRSAQIFPGTDPPCNDLWIAEDGLRIFTQCGNVFTASATASADMLWLGKLPVPASIRHLDHSHEAAAAALINDTNRIGADPDGDRRIELYDESTFSKVGSIPLPDFATANGSVPARGRFVFFDSAGKHLYVIVRATRGSGLLSDYGLVSLDAP